MKIAFLSNAPDFGTFRLGSHHLARHLALLGHEVAHISTPVSRWELATSREVTSRSKIFAGRPLESSKAALARMGVQTDRASVVHFSPRPTFPVRVVHRSRSTVRALSDCGFLDADIVLLDQLHLWPALSKFRGTIVYRPTDSVPEGFGRRLESKVVSRASAVVTCSPVVLEDLGLLVQGKPTMVLENGVDDEHFSKALVRQTRNGVIYVGAIDHRLDLQFVYSSARQYPSERFVIAGPISISLSVDDIPPNVQFVGPVEYESLPSLLSGFSVGLLPLNSDPGNVGRSPMKFYEYLSAGLYVVASATRTLVSRGSAPGALLYESASDGVDAVGSVVSKHEANGPGSVFAQQYSWRFKAAEMERFLNMLGPRS